MPQKAVADAVEARLASQWSLSTIIGANTEGEPPEDGSPFVVVQYPVANVSRPPLGDRLYREEGAFRLVSHTERGFGETKALDWAGQLAAIFRDQEFSGVITQVPSSPVIDDANDRAGYFVTSIACPYTYNFTG